MVENTEERSELVFDDLLVFVVVPTTLATTITMTINNDSNAILTDFFLGQKILGATRATDSLILSFSEPFIASGEVLS